MRKYNILDYEIIDNGITFTNIIENNNKYELETIRVDNLELEHYILHRIVFDSNFKFRFIGLGLISDKAYRAKELVIDTKIGV